MVRVCYEDAKSIKAVFAAACNPRSEWPKIEGHIQAFEPTCPVGVDSLRMDIQLHIRAAPDRVALLLYEMWVVQGKNQTQIANEMKESQTYICLRINQMLDNRVDALKWGLTTRILLVARELQER